MKTHHEEMHAAVEEVDLDPCDLYTELGTLVVEGRVPGLNDKGFGEGPHCSTAHGQSRHQCDTSSTECEKYDQILKHMLLLWKNGIPMTIEVLLYPACCAPLPSADSVHDMPYILLEQWTIHMLPRRVPDASITPRGLIQAVRSFLYFSQLCAWYSLTGGKSPQNVHYRVCVPGEAFSSKFSSQPDCHIFPVANVGRNHAMKVLMKCHPRCGEIPIVPCQKHSEPNLPLKTLKGREQHDPAAEYVYDGIVPRTSSPALGESLLDPPNSLCMYPKRYQSPSRCGSPSIEVPEHLMFGKKTEAPNPPRRSRPQRRPVVERFLKKNLGDSMCGNAEPRTYDGQKDKLKLGHCCIEDCVKHVQHKCFLKKNLGDPMGGSSEPRAYEVKKDKQPILKLGQCCIEDCMKHVPKDEMGHVLERFKDRHHGKKFVPNLGDCSSQEPRTHDVQKDKLGRCCIENCMKHVPKDEIDQVLESLRDRHHGKKFVPNLGDSELRTFEKQDLDIQAMKRDAALGYCSIEECMKHVPKNEMNQVLERLRDRHLRGKFVTDVGQSVSLKDEVQSVDTSSQPFDGYLEKMKVMGIDKRENIFSEAESSKTTSKQPSWQQEKDKTCENTNCDIKKTKPGDKIPSVHSAKVRGKGDSKFSLKDYKAAHLLADKFSPQSRAYKDQNSSNLLYPKSKVGCAIENGPKPQRGKTYQQLASKSALQSNVHPKYCSVNIKKCGGFLSKNDELTDERELPCSENNNQTLEPDELYDDEVSSVFHEIPSAEKKAIFRRSLDSATSLVFHQRSGLPLTSSPAPIRKCGTCFDYDSSLTSVSAIKRALFEKDNEEEVEEQDTYHLSTSAPASIFSSSLLGTFEESVLNGRLEPVSTVEGFTAEIGASGSFCPRHIRLPVTVFFYTLQDMDKVTSPYMGHIDLRSKDYHIPKKGTVQVTLFNPHSTVVKMFVVRYDLSDMPVNCQTFLRQRTLHMPQDAGEDDPDAQKWLRYLIHLRFMSSKSGRIYLHTDIRVIIFRKSDLDAATVHGQRPYELRTFTHSPLNPKFSPHKP